MSSGVLAVVLLVILLVMKKLIVKKYPSIKKYQYSIAFQSLQLTFLFIMFIINIITFKGITNDYFKILILITVILLGTLNLIKRIRKRGIF